MQSYDDLNDGSTTDGSISILGDHEINQDRFESEELSSHPPSPQPLQMWMRCTPVDMTICAKRPLEARPLEPNRCQEATSVEELGLPPQNIVEDILNYLERLNSFLASIYLLQVLLLFLTAGSVALLAIVYSRYSACKLEAKDLEQQLYRAKMDKYELRRNLSSCEYLYEMRVGKSIADYDPANENVDKTMPAAHSKSSCQRDDLNGECVIQPTRLSGYANKVDEVAPLKTSDSVWTGEGEDLLPTPKPLKSKDTYISECDDENSLFSEYNREYCENQKNRARDQKYQNEKIYSTHYSYKAIDDKTCNPNKIDFNLGIEHAKKILRESNCDDEGTMKYLQRAYDNFHAKSRNDAAKGRKENNKKFEKNGKWDKTQKFNDSAIKIGKSEENSPEERFDRKEKQERKKHHKERDSDKENKRKNERNDAKKYQPDADYGKWNKNDRKRDTVKAYEHRHGD